MPRPPEYVGISGSMFSGIIYGVSLCAEVARALGTSLISRGRAAVTN